jgi:hypothetical protein
MAIASRWAVILCKFKDDQSAPHHPITHYQRLFTGAGTGSLNMVDFFRDMSHGQLDLSGSQVFGWYQISANKSDYVPGVATPPPGTYGFDSFFDLCRQAAIDNGAPLDTFDGVVVSMNGSAGTWGGPPGVMRAFCDSFYLSPGILGEMMGHCYGLEDAMQDGSDANCVDPYCYDPWDVMSVFRAYMAQNDEWGTVGPGLNAQWMRSRGWLDETRVWKPSAHSFETVIQLRPLHRHDLSGFLAVELPGGYLVEYRPKERWDANFPRSAVFVHRFEDNSSYVMAGTAGNPDLVVADAFERGHQGGLFDVFASFTHLDVVAIDDSALVATIHLVCRPALTIPNVGPGILFGGIEKGGDGFFFLPGGGIHRVPPRSPEYKVLEQVALYLNSESINSIQIRNAVRQEALSTILALAQNQLQTIRDPRQVAPPSTTRGLEKE